MSDIAPTNNADTRATNQSRAIGRGSLPADISTPSLIDYLHNLPANYCNYIAAPEPQRLYYPYRIFVMIGLVLACAIPRIMIALQISGICPDAVLYIRLAEALNEGRYQQAFEGMNLNIYPAVLMLLNRLGLSWETAGMVWNVLISSLVVLPLFGWVRRQFDDTVALVACLLYAVQPIFIQWSPEIIRDPTFWFFFTLALYLMWRAVLEVRIGIFLAAGLSVTCAMLTRFEGFFLLIPLGLWTFWRYRALTQGRQKAKLATGGLLSAIAFPALILLINFTLLRNHTQWVTSRLYPLTLFRYWWDGMFSSAPALEVVGGINQIYSGVSFMRLIVIYVPALVKGLSVLFALLMLAGLWRWRRVWLRRDQQAMFYTGLAIMAATWIHAWCAKESCDRYFLPMVLMGSGYGALGLLALSGGLLSFIERLKSGSVLVYTAIFAPLILVAFVGWNVAFSGHFDRRAAEVELGSWVRKEFGPSAMIFGSEGVAPVVAYYAKVNWTTLSKIMDDETVLKSVEQINPDVVLLLATRRKDLMETRQLIKKIEKLNYTEIERSNLPHGTDDVLVVLSRGQVEPPVRMETGGKPISRK